MRIEVRCHACARRYLLDAVFAGTLLPCPTCGAADGLRVPAAKRAEPARVDDTAPQIPASRPARAIDDTTPQRRVAPPTPSVSAPVPLEHEVVCPRCKL